ncbi:hypothetical protein NW754_014302 [Fusarium falciforme]|nr:hypothetical protein NW754_014302 [Fusarium falciforme]
MEAPYQEKPIHQSLEYPNKRPIDRALSTSPPQAIKRVCLEQDLQQDDRLCSVSSSYDPHGSSKPPREWPPPTPSSYGRGGPSNAGPSGSSARTGTPSGISASGGKTGSLVENPLYEDLNLAANNIYYRDRREPLPQHVANLFQRVQRERNSPAPSISDILADDGLAALERGAGEPTVEQYFQNNLVPQPPRNDPLKRSDKAPFQKHAVPNTGTQYRVSNPTPDVTSGYNLSAFTTAQKMQLGKTPNMSAMNNEGMCFPFFILEFKGDGPSSNGSL